MERIKRALIAADSAGDAAAATALAKELRKHMTAPEPERPKSGGIMGAVRGFNDFTQGVQRSVIDGLTLGGGDEVEAGIGAALSPRGYDEVLQETRAEHAKFKDQNPITSTIAEVGGAANPIGAGAKALRGASLLKQTVTAAGSGAALGGAYAFNEGEGGAQQRIDEAPMGAGLGAVFGAAGPSAARVIGEGVTRLRNSNLMPVLSKMPARQAAKELGVSEDAVKIVTEAVKDANGAGVMLADTSQTARGMLDTAVQSSGQAAELAGDVVQARAGQAKTGLSEAFDKAFGSVLGKDSARQNIREGTAALRDMVYEAAYSKPIDYSQPIGRRLEGYLSRVPGSAINKANDLMKLEGLQSNQIMAQIADNGLVTYNRMPDVRQLDYITRALNDVVKKNDGMGAMGGMTDQSRATSNLSNQIRTALKRAVPEYKTALDTAATSIRSSQAVETGYGLLSSGVTRDMARTSIRGMSRSERKAATQGIRDYIDDQMANVQRAITDGNVDAREAMKAIKLLSSRSNQEKIALVIGQGQAKRLQRSVDQMTVALELRSSIATNSRTQGRQVMKQFMDDIRAPGVAGEIAQGSPAKAAQRLIQEVTGKTPDALAATEKAVFADVAELLVGRTGPEAARALKVLKKVAANQPIAESDARNIARIASTLGALSSYQGSRQLLGTGQ